MFAFIFCLFYMNLIFFPKYDRTFFFSYQEKIVIRKRKKSSPVFFKFLINENFEFVFVCLN